MENKPIRPKSKRISAMKPMSLKELMHLVEIDSSNRKNLTPFTPTDGIGDIWYVDPIPIPCKLPKQKKAKVCK